MYIIVKIYALKEIPVVVVKVDYLDRLAYLWHELADGDDSPSITAKTTFESNSVD